MVDGDGEKRFEERQDRSSGDGEESDVWGSEASCGVYERVCKLMLASTQLNDECRDSGHTLENGTDWSLGLRSVTRISALASAESSFPEDHTRERTRCGSDGLTHPPKYTLVFLSLSVPSPSWIRYQLAHRVLFLERRLRPELC